MISKEDKKERRVLTVSEAELFLGEAQSSFYYNLFVLAIETGMRIGELCGVQWKDIDFDKKVLYVRHTLCYFQKMVSTFLRCMMQRPRMEDERFH